jgi:hypothetical protein
MCKERADPINVFKRECVNVVTSTTFCIVGSYAVYQFQYIIINSSSGLEHSIASWNITYPANAWSSIFYALPNTELHMKIPLMSLAITSFNLWSDSTSYISFADMTCIYWVTFCATLCCIPSIYPKRRTILVVNTATVVFISTAIYTDYYIVVLEYYKQNIVVLTGVITTCCAAFLSTFHCHRKDFIVGSICIILGFVCKLQTIYYDQYWGTSVFHILTALGIFILLKSDDIQSAQQKICDNPINNDDSTNRV